jgi:hypothetical protein
VQIWLRQILWDDRSYCNCLTVARYFHKVHLHIQNSIIEKPNNQSNIRQWNIINKDSGSTDKIRYKLHLLIRWPPSMLNEITIYIGQYEFACHKQRQPQSVCSLRETIPPRFQSNYWFPHTTADSPWQFFFSCSYAIFETSSPKCNYYIYSTYYVKFVKCLYLLTVDDAITLIQAAASNTRCLWGRTAPSQSLGLLGTQK